jgi:hypothetical protein
VPALRTSWSWALGVASAAVVVVAVLCGLLVDAHRTGDENRPGLASVLGSAITKLGGTEPEFLKARAELLQALEQRSAALAPQTLAVVMENLRLIDTNIGEIAAAMEANPDHPRLSRLLAAACRQEIELLQRAVSMPSQLDTEARPESQQPDSSM